MVFEEYFTPLNQVVRARSHAQVRALFWQFIAFIARKGPPLGKKVPCLQSIHSSLQKKTPNSHWHPTSQIRFSVQDEVSAEKEKPTSAN